MSEAASRVLGAGTVGAATAGLVSGAASAYTGEWLAYDLDPAGEGNVFAWASTVATFAAGLAAALHALTVETRRGRFAVLAAVCAFLSLDDMTTMHERLGAEVFDERLGMPDYLAGQLEITLYAPMLLAAAVIGVDEARRAPRAVARRFAAGFGLLALAVACELVGVGTRRLATDGTAVPDKARRALEEAAELSGWILVAAAIAALLVCALDGCHPTAVRESRPSGHRREEAP